MSHQKKVKTGESGRSMVEMLGVLAIMGVLAIGGIAGYRYAVCNSGSNKICPAKHAGIKASKRHKTFETFFFMVIRLLLVSLSIP